MKTQLSKPQIIKITLLICVSILILLWSFAGKFGNNTEFDEKNAHRSGPFKIQVILNPKQPKVGNNDLTIIIMDKDNNPVIDAQIKAVAEMPAMGTMPAMPAPATMVHSNNGVYHGTFELLMNGAWPLTLDIDSKSSGSSHLEFDLTTSRAGLRFNTINQTEMSQSSITTTHAATDSISHYTCSMHPTIHSTTPGACPICGMDLVAVKTIEMSSGKISMDARRRQLIGVTTSVAEIKNMTKTIRAASRITYNQTKLTDISLKYNGWIGELYADSIGSTVHKGQALFTVYSPDLLSAQREYLETLRRRKGTQNSLLQAARRRLTLWDIATSQITELEKRRSAIDYMPILSPSTGVIIEKTIVAGSAAKSGQKLLRIADLSSVWVEGNIYEYEIPLVKTGIIAQVLLPEFPNLQLSGKVSYISPYLKNSSRTALVRVVLDNNNVILKPNMFATILLEIDLGQRLVVPEAAVLYAGSSRVVFIDRGNGQLQPQKITTGIRNSDVIEVIAGLAPGDIVVTSGNFLIAAESKLKAGIDQW